jgi:hypothetical protein
MGIFAITRWPGVMPPNFSAAYALVFCAGIYFPRKLAWWLPLSTLLLSDMLMNHFYYHTDLVSVYMLVNYLIFGALIWLGTRFSARDSFLKLLSGGLLGAVLFYLTTNSAAWLQNPEYAKNFQGWIQALTVGTAGWPETWKFFRNTLLSGGLFTALFVGIMKLTVSSEPLEKEEPEAEETEPAPEGTKASGTRGV